MEESFIKKTIHNKFFISSVIIFVLFYIVNIFDFYYRFIPENLYFLPIIGFILLSTPYITGVAIGSIKFNGKHKLNYLSGVAYLAISLIALIILNTLLISSLVAILNNLSFEMSKYSIIRDSIVAAIILGASIVIFGIIYFIDRIKHPGKYK